MRSLSFPIVIVASALLVVEAGAQKGSAEVARTPAEHQQTANQWLAEAVASLQEASDLRRQAFIDLTKGNSTSIHEDVDGIVSPLEGSLTSARTVCSTLDSQEPAEEQVQDVRVQMDEIASIRDQLESERLRVCEARERVSRMSRNEALALAEGASSSGVAWMRELQEAARAALDRVRVDTRDASVSTGMPRTVRYVLGQLNEAGDSLGQLEERLLAEAPARRAVEKLNAAQERIENTRHLLKMASELIEPYRSRGIALDSELVLEAGTLMLEVKDVDDGLIEARQYEAELLMVLSSAVGDGQRQVGLWQRELEECSGVREALSDVALVDAQINANESLVAQMETSIAEAESCAAELQTLAAARPEEALTPEAEPELAEVSATQTPPSEAAQPAAEWGKGEVTESETAQSAAEWGKGEVRELEAQPGADPAPAAGARTTQVAARDIPPAPQPPPPAVAPAPVASTETLVQQAQAANESCSYDEALAIMGRIEQADPFHPWVARHSTEISVKARRSRQAIGELEEAMRLMQQGNNAEAVAVLSRARLNASPCDIETVDTLFRDAASLTNRDRIAKEQALQQQAVRQQQAEQAALQEEAEKRERRQRTWGAIFGGLSGALQTMNMRSGGAGGLGPMLGGSSGGNTGQIVQQLAPVVQQTLSAAAGQDAGNMLGTLTPMLTGGQPGFPTSPSFAGGVTQAGLSGMMGAGGSAQAQGACQVSAAPAATTTGSVFVFRSGQSTPIYSIAAIRPDLATQLVAEYQSRGWQQVYGPAMSIVDAQAWVDRICPPQNRIQIPPSQ